MLNVLFPKQWVVSGIDDTGVPIKNTYYAPTAAAAKNLAIAESIRVTGAPQEIPSAFMNGLKKGQIEIGRPASNREMGIFCRQLAQMIANNVQLNRAFDILSSGAKPRFRQVILGIQRGINDGQTLAQAMGAFPEQFDSTFIAIIQAAESAGQVPGALREIAESLMRGDKALRKVRMASLYPAAVASVAMIAFLVFTNVVLPKMAALYENTPGGLPLITRVMIGVSKAMRSNPILPLAALGLPIFLFTQRKRIQEQPLVQDIAIKLPVLSGLIEKTCLVRILQLKAQFASNAVPVLRQYALCEKAAGHRRYAKAMKDIRGLIAAGNPESAAWATQKHIPRIISAQLAAAESTGSTLEVLKDLTKFYNEELDDAITTFTAVIEPVMIVFLVFFIGTMVIAMYAPIFNLGDALKNRA